MESFNNFLFKDPDVQLLLNACKTLCTQLCPFVSAYVLVCIALQGLDWYCPAPVEDCKLPILDYNSPKCEITWQSQ